MKIKALPERAAFTLLELLVTIGIIGLLAGLLLPALSRSKSKAYLISCASNSKQLMVAWYLYADDNATFLPPNENGIPGEYLASKTWIDGWLTYDPTSSWNTNEDYLVDPMHATLASYLRSAKVYRCPSDPINFGNQPRVRSVSMNQAMGMSDTAQGQRSEKPWTIITEDTAKRGDNFYKLYAQTSQLDQPSSRWVFIDEHPDSINDGSFCIILPQTGQEPVWWDLPASTHDNASAVTFADGHAERHEWKVKSTLRKVARQPMARGSSSKGEDFDWLSIRTSTFLGAK